MVKSTRGKEKRDALVAACAELFWQKGYANTSISDIAGHAGIPVGNVYYYFRSKAEMADAVAAVFVAETESLIGDISAQTEEPRERLAALVQRLAQSARSRVAHGCPIGGCVHEFRRDAEPAADRAAEAFSLLVGFMARELGRTGLRPSAAMAAARGALSDWQGGIVLAHALRDTTVMADSFRRMERTLRLAQG